MLIAPGWDAYYAGVEHPFCSATEEALTSRIDRLPPGRAIDLGCGLGRHARHLAELGWTVQAVDFSCVAIEIAATADGPDVTYLVDDVTRWRPTEPVDLILTSFLHLRANDLLALLASAKTWLAPGGHLIYLGHAPLDGVDGGRGGPHGDFPGIPDLARACEGMRIDELAHVVRSHVETTTVDVVLHARNWWTADSSPPPITGRSSLGHHDHGRSVDHGVTRDPHRTPPIIVTSERHGMILHFGDDAPDFTAHT
jgi:SAM-dependent methyltransferase